jgi:hypothetical protein
MKLISAINSNPKVEKNFKKLGVLTANLHLAPYNVSGYQVCPMASAGCIKACLNTAGRGGIFKVGATTNAIQEARKRKTKMYFEQREEFMQQLIKDILSVKRKAKKMGVKKVGLRLNTTSDVPWERVAVEYEGIKYKNIMGLFPDIQFYDYTKRSNRKNLPMNYHLTFSLAEDNDKAAEEAFNNGMNVAVVFNDVPKIFKLGSKVVPVIDGDERKNVIVGLKAKGKAKQDKTGFVR